MASNKYYAYYLRGNKIAVVQQDYAYGDGQTLNQPSLDDIGPSGAYQWKSPLEDIANGLEIEYAYSLKYSVSGASTINVNRFYVNGWTIIGGYLAFVKGVVSSHVDWTASPYNAVTSGTASGSSDYIVVRGSNRWDGLHKVQTAGAEGQLITYTKVKETVPYFEDQDLDTETVDDSIYDGGGSSNLNLHAHFSTSDYIWLSGSAASNNGLYSINSVTASDTDTSSKLLIGTQYYTTVQTNTVDKDTDLNEEASKAGSFLSTSGLSTVNIYKAYRDFCYIDTDVNILNDESDVLDVTEYQSKALVYYVKAKLAEDRMDIEAKEYFMKEFHKILEKHESGRVWGQRVVIPGSHAVR